MKIVRGSQDIQTLDDWREAMPARLREKQWKVGRSAMELGRSWVGGGRVAIPDEVDRLLQTSPEFSGTTLEEGRPEEETKLDDFRGNTRNADLLLIGKRNGQPIVIAVEAKADESFGPTIGDYLEEKEQVEGSNAPARIRQLSQAVFGTTPEDIRELRYQLLHAAAATLIAADDHGAARALFLIHEFLNATDRRKVKANTADLEKLLQRLGWNGELGAGRIAGPFNVPGGGRVPADVGLFVGKVQRGG